MILPKLLGKGTKKRLFLSFITLAFFTLLSFAYITSLDHLSDNCFLNRYADKNKVLEDILTSRKQPRFGKNIFFHETSCSFDGVVNLNARQACAIESAAKQNPDWNVFVLFASAVGFRNKSQLPIIDSLHQYSNIHLRFVNLTTYAEKTPLDEWMQSGEIFRSKYMNSHLSDVMRYLSLWKFGGTYLDLDVIVKKPFEAIKPNYAGAESENFVAAGFINFEHQGFGHQMADMCVRDLLVNFDGSDWGNNGPGVITRVLHQVCHTTSPQQMTRDRCHGFNVFPIKAIYAVGWKQFNYFFEERYLNKTLQIVNESIVVHVWNKFSKEHKIRVGSRVAYGVLASEYCPKVYSTCGEYF